MATIDYASVTREDLEMKREPRKSKFVIVHKPTGTIAQNPVAPGTYTEARFRRPTILPKENRTKDMEGYIEGRDTPGMWVITVGDTPRNEYLEALAGDAEALRRSFEGQPSTDSGEKSSDDASGKTATDAPDTAPAEASDQPAPEPETAEVSSDTEDQLDDLLAQLDAS